MRRSLKLAIRHPLLRSLVAWLGLAGALGLASSTHADVGTERAVLEARVLAVRAALLDGAEAGDPLAQPKPPRTPWLNWNNWGNWNNWPNWGNWGNWLNR